MVSLSLLSVTTSAAFMASSFAINASYGRSDGFVAEDTGGGLKGKHIDVFMASHERALKAGVRNAVVWVRKNG